MGPPERNLNGGKQWPPLRKQLQWRPHGEKLQVQFLDELGAIKQKKTEKLYRSGVR